MRPLFLVRDRDSKVTREFDEVFHAYYRYCFEARERTRTRERDAEAERTTRGRGERGASAAGARF